MNSAPTAADVARAMDELGDPGRALELRRFFKTGPGDYGEGDVFLGVPVPQTRKVAKQFSALPVSEIAELLRSPVHEHRLAALVIANNAMAKAGKPRTYDVAAQQEIVEMYLAAVRGGLVNNWDLVDVSAENILGPWLLERPRDLLDELARSESLWERRVALLTTFAFIKAGDASTTFALCERLLDDRRDLIQKAVGWMLREVGKRVDRALLTEFLDRRAHDMGRTALSYATEHLEPETRAAYRAQRQAP
ncbi:DNA alkylation repair protein [Nocardia nova]|uniref:DNA alkylation repair protein n=1 Tax=Nocardia nova TaxID=37330 RepID=UPI001895A575|nr:DNA alkylation repair protein [Nocardia nova]MBF6145723.1 DNA alkylation repair protein [Nocardia nova]MDN2500372.1 DNA alkylation repair protein [Nocardia nova]